MVLVLISGGEN
jgi:glyoxylase-like metal-dependent hydrolase (beta-lactamase superfamily II)